MFHFPFAQPQVRWPASAVHDTIAAIMHQRAYQRSLRTSLLERFFQLLGEWWRRLVTAAGSIPHGRYVAIALVSLTVLLVIARIIYAARLREQPSDQGRIARRRTDISVAPLDEAQRLANEGRYADAAHALYRAVLQLLAVRERLRLHPSKTSGEYARELRARRSPSYEPFRAFGRRYDRALFGTQEFDAGSYEELRRCAEATIQGARAA